MTEIAKRNGGPFVRDVSRVCIYRLLRINSIWVRRCRIYDEGNVVFKRIAAAGGETPPRKITLKFEKFDGTLETDWSSLGGTPGGRLQLLTERIFLLPSTANRLSETVGSFVKAKNHVHEIYFDFIFFRLHRLSAPSPNVDLSWNKLCYPWLNITK